jgi:3-deoxy-manno-octulosonate cytidylyltransferase (CMP-KDO synthetase)
MRILGVIPARVASSRIPHKPLQTIADQPLIRLVAQRVLEFGYFEQVVVATDDRRVVDAVGDLEIDTVMTATGCRNGTERVAEVAAHPRFAGAEVVVNVQGDEPFLPLEAVSGAVAALERDRRAGIGTVGGPLAAGALDDPHTVKVFVDARGRAVGFSRGPRLERGAGGAAVLHHVGVYAYRPASLARWAAGEPVESEVRHQLEQLRPLSYGEAIAVTALDQEAPRGIDTTADLERARALMAVIR